MNDLNSSKDLNLNNKIMDFLQQDLRLNIGGFSGTYDIHKYISESDILHPLLTISTDGVGSKILIAEEVNNYINIGIDLFAMVINDIITDGSTPIIFMDYISLNFKKHNQYYKEILHSLKSLTDKYKINFIGGETANHDFTEHIDLSAFGIGIIDKSKQLSKERVMVSDNIFAIPSNGFHSNGFTVIRSILSKISNTDEYYRACNEILRPTFIYIDIVKNLLQKYSDNIHSMVNITGGGISNLKRSIPDNLSILLDRSLFKIHDIIKYIINLSGKEPEYFESIFNMGIGYIVITDKKIDKIDCGYIIGKVTDKKEDEILSTYKL